ncbi:hypothetical protein SPRG_02505 [Saprolegnia parasitica CBS 223.65]|uniref:Uncharacterized protein n=1 Tax=Saprolegnia parasitica (strain CBS 223.65) TaxID=695850 RepID=A0A067D1A2_SAPPC|nr:hypothetical protein SPRG_02505 [Saprolegnia parasitica CBS 223.65]KDO32812.1 hypothetical protein SPRG_02505 [Saprolegnia parasitica CBS 223.65]|eukprot:XP_012196468.1 hypothetical protein SPRG_02505 [Saprolegnia parasitica CBS 223.65]
MQSPLPMSPMARPPLKLPPRGGPMSPPPPSRLPALRPTELHESPAPLMDVSQTASWLRDDDAIYGAYEARQTPYYRSVQRPAPPKPDNAALHRQCVDAIAFYAKQVDARRVQMDKLKLYAPRKASEVFPIAAYDTKLYMTPRSTKTSPSPPSSSSSLHSLSPVDASTMPTVPDDEYSHVQQTLRFDALSPPSSPATDTPPMMPVESTTGNASFRL